MSGEAMGNGNGLDPVVCEQIRDDAATLTVWFAQAGLDVAVIEGTYDDRYTESLSYMVELGVDTSIGDVLGVRAGLYGMFDGRQLWIVVSNEVVHDDGSIIETLTIDVERIYR